MTLSPVEIREIEQQPTAVVRRRVTLAELQRIPDWLRETYEAIQRAGIKPAGMPFVRTFEMDDVSHTMDIEVGWPVGAPFAGEGDIQPSSLPAGPMAVTSYFGPYDGIGAAYEAVQAWCAEQGKEVVGPPWESYFTDPNEEPDQSKWRTDVHFPVHR